MLLYVEGSPAMLRPEESFMTHTVHDIGVASQIGAYSDAVEARPNLRSLLTSGTPGLSTTGEFPKDIWG